jgi:hypothetical protein
MADEISFALRALSLVEGGGTTDGDVPRSSCDLDAKEKKAYNNLIRDGKAAEEACDYFGALESYRAALAMAPGTEKVEMTAFLRADHHPRGRTHPRL